MCVSLRLVRPLVVENTLVIFSNIFPCDECGPVVKRVCVQLRLVRDQQDLRADVFSRRSDVPPSL